MFGSILKYTAVALAGAVVFTTSAFFMDADVVDMAKQACEDYALSQADLPEVERKDKIKAFIVIHRAEWVAQLTFATSVKDLDAVLATWA